MGLRVTPEANVFENANARILAQQQMDKRWPTLVASASGPAGLLVPAKHKFRFGRLARSDNFGDVSWSGVLYPQSPAMDDDRN
jgi:hypothetical protein